MSENNMGAELGAKKFYPGQLVIYSNGTRRELGRVKRMSVDGEAAFVYYSSGETAARTSLRDIEPLANAYTITGATLGGEEGRLI